MDRKSTKDLRLDQRLTSRRNWISSADLEKELSALPDVSHKIAEPQEERESNPESEGEPQPEALTSNELDRLNPSPTGV
jgi:hypothetical protein